LLSATVLWQKDALSEAYARALRRWDDVAEHPYPSGWVMRTALN
jgi:hypothetical protein